MSFLLIFSKVQYFFAFKSVIAPIIFLAVFGHTLHKAGGTISNSSVITQGPTVSGSVLVWAFFSSMLASSAPVARWFYFGVLVSFFLHADDMYHPDLNGVLGNYSTLGLNIADFSRYANKPSAPNVQAIVIPCIFS